MSSREEIERQWDEHWAKQRGEGDGEIVDHYGYHQRDYSRISGQIDDFFQQVLNEVHQQYREYPTFPPIDLTPEEESLQSYHNAEGLHAAMAENPELSRYYSEYANLKEYYGWDMSFRDYMKKKSGGNRHAERGSGSQSVGGYVNSQGGLATVGLEIFLWLLVLFCVAPCLISWLFGGE